MKGGDNKRESNGNETPIDANPSDNGRETASTNRDGIARVVEDEDASEIIGKELNGCIETLLNLWLGRARSLIFANLNHN